MCGLSLKCCVLVRLKYFGRRGGGEVINNPVNSVIMFEIPIGPVRTQRMETDIWKATVIKEYEVHVTLTDGVQRLVVVSAVLIQGFCCQRNLKFP